MSFNKIYEDAKDLHVKKYVVYGKAADKKLYYESTYTTQVSANDAKDAFDKGLLMIVDGTTTLVPVAMSTTKVSTVGGTTTAATITEWTVKAD